MNRERQAATFIEMLLTLLEENISLSNSMRILSRSGISSSIRNTAQRIHDIMKKGISFSVALQSLSEGRQNRVTFSPLYISLIASAEITGNLVPVLRDINTDFIRKKTNRENLYNALIYPCIIILIAFVGTLFVIGKGIPLYIKSGMTSAVTAESVVAGIACAGFFLFISGLALFLVCHHFFATESVEFRIFYLLTFLLRAQIPLSSALSQCILYFGETKAGRALVLIKHEINSGVSLSRAFDNTSFFSSFVIGWLTITDEQAGAIQIFSSLTEYYKKKDQRKREILSRLIEPAVIVLTGIYLLILIQTAILPLLTSVGGFL